MGNPSQSRGTPWMMCQWLEQMKRRSKRRIYLKIFLRLWAIKILLSLLTAMGFSITTSNGVFAQDLPHITCNCSDMVCFQSVSSSPSLLSHLMCFVKNRFSNPTKVQEGRDRPRKDIMNRRQGKALSKGCRERKKAWTVVSSREKINNNKNLVRVTTKSKSKTQTVSNGRVG